MTDQWKFAQLQCIEEYSFNKVLERFRDNGVTALVKENIQNSLDAKLEDEIPVSVNIEIGTMISSEIPGINEIRDHIDQLKGRNNYTKETIDNMKDKMNSFMVDYISFEDSNTKGLKYVSDPGSSLKDTWCTYAYHKGDHAEAVDSDAEKLRGGSHGIGKIASNAASDLYMMFFANCDEAGNQHLGGTVQLIEHQYHDKYYRATGYYTDERNCANNQVEFFPYRNVSSNHFKKDTRGLKIIIPFFREVWKNEDEIVRCVCDNFFLAILKEKLVVNINGKVIDAESIGSFISDPALYEQDIKMIKDNFTPLYYSSYQNQEPMEIAVNDKKQEYKFDLYFQYNEDIKKGRMAVVRTIGMKIEDFKVKNNATKPFNALLIPKTTDEDVFLKSLENESHTQLSFEHFNAKENMQNAKKFLSNLSAKVAEIIEDHIRQNNQVDGKLNTDDIIYNVENQFRQELSKAMSTVQLLRGQKHLVQVNAGIKKKKKDKDKTKELNGKQPTGDGGEKDPVKPKLRKHKEKSEDDKTVYTTDPSIVERVITGDTEYLQFNFTNNPDLKSVKECALSMAVVDGMGEVIKESYQIKDNYELIQDIRSDRTLDVNQNAIQHIDLSSSIIKLKLKRKKDSNRSLKFIYYVEVAE